MVAQLSSRELLPGSTGWCLSHLAEPGVLRRWEAARVEMIEGVIASKPAGRRCLVPGAVGFCIDDLAEAEFARAWEANRYEMVRGVIAQMPPPFFEHGSCVHELVFLVRSYFAQRGVKVWSSGEVDMVVSEDLIFRADAVLLVGDDRDRQGRGVFADDQQRTRITAPPTLVIESVSIGHERHDRHVKRKFYAEFGVPNYWIVDAGIRSLVCLRLNDGAYVQDAEGHDVGEVRPSAFPGLTVSLKDVFS